MPSHECVEHCGYHRWHDSKQHERRNETDHHRQHTAYADRSSSHLQGTTPRLPSRCRMMLQALHRRGAGLRGSCQVRGGESQLWMIIQNPPGVHVSDTQLHQRHHLTKIISHGTVEGFHDGRTCRAGGQAGGEARRQELQSLRPFP